MRPRDTALELSQPEERGPTPGPSNSASGLASLQDVDTTTWTDLIDQSFLASLFAPDTASIVSAPAEGTSSGYGHPDPQYGIPSMPSPPRGQTYPLPQALSVQAPTFDHRAECASTTMHNYSHISQPQLEYKRDTAGALLQTTPVGHSYSTSNLNYWSPPSSSSRQIGNTQADSDESRRKRQKRKHDDIENQEEKYRSQYGRTFEN